MIFIYFSQLFFRLFALTQTQRLSDVIVQISFLDRSKKKSSKHHAPCAKKAHILSLKECINNYDELQKKRYHTMWPLIEGTNWQSILGCVRNRQKWCEAYQNPASDILDDSD